VLRINFSATHTKSRP